MNKKSLKIALAIAGVAVVTSFQFCTNKPEPTEEKTVAQEKLLGTKAILDREVSFSLATACVKKYSQTSVNNIIKPDSILFEKTPLRDWIVNLDKVTKYDKMVIKLGIYTPEILVGHPDSANMVGHVTVFLFPTLKNQPALRLIKKSNEEKEVPPFNMGEVHP